MAVKSNDTNLSELLKTVGNGKSQLPDFQRSWVWDDTRICKLIESLTSGFPMGAAMFLDYSPDAGIRFKYRLFERVDKKYESVVPDSLVLDGQQRLTTLYQVFMSKAPVITRTDTDKESVIKRYYYMDIKKAINPEADRLEAIISISEDKTKTENIGRDLILDLRTREDEYKNLMFPLNLTFSDTMDWIWGLITYNKEVMPIVQKFQQDILEPLKKYTFPVITLAKDTTPEAVCQIFENVNTGGVTLTVFELVTAKFAAMGSKNLREEWNKLKTELNKRNDDLLKDLSGPNFLTSMTLLLSYMKMKKGERQTVSCKKKDVLKLEYNEFFAHLEDLKQGFTSAANFMVQQGIYKSIDIPYSTQLIPLAAIFAYDNMNGKKLGLMQNLDLMSKWFWCGVFGELYGSANETRFAQDIVGIFEWMDDANTVPETVTRANFDATRLLWLQTRNSAAYKGVMALINRQHPKDFMSGQDMGIANYLLELTDIHHLFPQAYCTKEQLPSRKWNSVVNKTPIYAATNRSIGGKAPSLYVQTIRNKGVIEEKIDDALKSHNINPALLKSDSFNAFIVDRAKRLLNLIENAMGKAVSGRESDSTIQNFGEALTANEEKFTQNIVSVAADLAKRLHVGQVDKAGVDYFSGHLSAVASMGTTWKEQVVGYLHDASEDTPYTVKEVLDMLDKDLDEPLPSECREELATALLLLNHHTAPDRDSYIRAVGTNVLATAVKLHDLTHNMDLSRISPPTEKDLARANRYRIEYDYLNNIYQNKYRNKPIQRWKAT
ncbi:MAG: DUF262 domain-containing protein [Alloprevotella sp.]